MDFMIAQKLIEVLENIETSLDNIGFQLQMMNNPGQGNCQDCINFKPKLEVTDDSTTR